jgi:uncharacterized Zn finger protein
MYGAPAPAVTVPSVVVSCEQCGVAGAHELTGRADRSGDRVRCVACGWVGWVPLVVPPRRVAALVARVASVLLAAGRGWWRR